MNLVTTGNGAAPLQNWTIDWGDGTPPEQVPGGIAEVEHVYTDSGSAIIWATASDGQSTFIAGTVQVQVGRVRRRGTGSAAAAAGVTYTLNLTVASGQPTPDHWNIDWGDGSETQVSGGSQQVQHTFASAGSVGILTTVTDSLSTRDVGLIGVTVSGTTPTAPVPHDFPHDLRAYGLERIGRHGATAAPDEYEITGSVVNAAGVPVSDALVQLDLDGSGTAERTTRTDDSGNSATLTRPHRTASRPFKAQVVEWNAGAGNGRTPGPWLSDYVYARARCDGQRHRTHQRGDFGSQPGHRRPDALGPDRRHGDRLHELHGLVRGRPRLQYAAKRAGQCGRAVLRYSARAHVQPDCDHRLGKREWTDPATGLQIAGTATELTFIYYVPPQAPSLAELGLAASTDPSGVIAGTNPTIAGAIDPNAPALSGMQRRSESVERFFRGGHRDDRHQRKFQRYASAASPRRRCRSPFMPAARCKCGGSHDDLRPGTQLHIHLLHAARPRRRSPPWACRAA